MNTPEANLRIKSGRLAVAGLVLLALSAATATAKQEYRNAFFAVYPSAVGSAIETVPSQTNHCGVCHYRFTGGGTRNPFGALVEATLPGFPNTDQGRQDAIYSIRNQDPDGDGFSTLIEVTDTANYANTPTFPGLTPGNVNQVTNVNIAEIQDHLVPLSGGDNTPPAVTVVYPNGGETLVANSVATIQWIATDASGVAGVFIYSSLDGGATYSLIGDGLTNTGSFTWFPPNRPSLQARIRVEAVDSAFNFGFDESDAVFTIESPPGGIVSSTLRDFDLPGSQPLEAGILNPPEACAVCHGGYDAAVEPYFNWAGSMMAQASLDPLFKACMAVANQDAPDSGDLCLRCHISRGWLQGRSVPTDGSQMLVSDNIGVACDLCHRLVDPIASPENPAEDAAILAALSMPTYWFGTGMFTVDPTGARRGPFVDADSGHPILVSPFHRESALCGTCHDVSNPAFERDANGNYLPNAFDAPATDFSPHRIGPVERTYSEWLASAYNTPQGVYAPQFGGNKVFVASCQDCHMRDVTGKGCNANPPVRTDLPLHDMTGGSAWLAGLLPTLFPGEVDPAAMQAGVQRTRYMLQNAARLELAQTGRTVFATVFNDTGHKLPTGYPEGRRMWLNVQFLNAADELVAESAAYDPDTAVLSHDAQAKIYEIEPATLGIPGMPDGSLFHFVLNNAVHKDNRIPPRGFTNAAFDAFGGLPVGATYADGQYWDHTPYTVPPDAVTAVVTLYYQSTSKEFIEFLRDENVSDSSGQDLYNLWAANGKCPPELMAQAELTLAPPLPGDFDGDGYVDASDFAAWTDCLNGPDVAYPGGCAPADAMSDGDVDLQDFADLQRAYTGPDLTPPAAPSGLAAVGSLYAVNLTWNPALEPEIAGYIVYRADNSGGPFTALTGDLWPTNSFVDSTGVENVTYYYVVTAADDSGNESAPSNEASAAPQGSSTMHVAALVLTLDDQGGGNKYAVATVTIANNLGVGVADATVTGTFSGDFIGTSNAVTNAAGVAELRNGPKGGRTVFSFCVDNVTHATLTYDPVQNLATCDAYP